MSGWDGVEASIGSGIGAALARFLAAPQRTRCIKFEKGTLPCGVHWSAMSDAASSTPDNLAPGRGRQAHGPEEIPTKGWLDIALRFWRGFNNDNLILVAAGVAYFALLAVFPLIVLFVSIYGLIADPSSAANHAAKLAGVMPPLASEFIFAEMGRVSSAGKGGLSLVSILSFGIVVFGAGRAAKAMFQALNVAYGEHEDRNIIVINLLGILFTFGFLIAGVLGISLVVALPPVLEAIALPVGAETAISIIRWPLLFLGMAAATSILYRFGPSREPARFRWISLGSVAAALLWILVSGLISYYASNITDFSATYGTFGAVILLQMWLWATALVILVGAKLNAETEHQTAKDTTTGVPEPIGRRGARVADHLGRTRKQGAEPVKVEMSEAG
jgi:membrane protein